jgi:conjugative transfer signal peptidase TraF
MMKTLALTFGVSSVLGLSALAPPPPRLVWNASESVPIGLYAVQPVERLTVTQLVLVKPPEPLATFLDQGRYIPRGVPLLKRIAALPGQTVCRTGAEVTVDRIAIATARERDRRGRLLPVWAGCWTLMDGEVFLLNWDEPSSLDGRYFGPLPRTSIVGRATPVWTREDG